MVQKTDDNFERLSVSVDLFVAQGLVDLCRSMNVSRSALVNALIREEMERLRPMFGSFDDLLDFPEAETPSRSPAVVRARLAMFRKFASQPDLFKEGSGAR